MCHCHVLLGFLFLGFFVILLGVLGGAVLEQALNPSNDITHELNLDRRVHLALELKVHDVKDVALELILQDILLVGAQF